MKHSSTVTPGKTVAVQPIRPEDFPEEVDIGIGD